MELDLGIADFDIQRPTTFYGRSLDHGRQYSIERFPEILDDYRMATLKARSKLAHHAFLTRVARSGNFD